MRGGEQQMVMIGRGGMPKPKLFLVDQPRGGWHPLLLSNFQKLSPLLTKKGMSALFVG